MTSSTTSRKARVLAVGAALAVVVSVLVVGVGAAVAQEGADNSTESPTPQGESNESEADTEVVTELNGDPDIRILSYHYNESTSEFVIEFENTRPRGEKSVTVTEAVSRSSKDGGASAFGIRVVSVPAEDTLTLRMKLRGASDDPGVMITTADSVDAGQGTQLWAEKPASGNGGLIHGSASWTDVQLTALTVGVIVLLAIILAVWQKVSEEAHGAEEVDLS